jgi:hypothetical protein
MLAMDCAAWQALGAQTTMIVEADGDTNTCNRPEHIAHDIAQAGGGLIACSPSMVSPPDTCRRSIQGELADIPAQEASRPAVAETLDRPLGCLRDGRLGRPSEECRLSHVL